MLNSDHNYTVGTFFVPNIRSWGNKMRGELLDHQRGKRKERNIQREREREREREKERKRERERESYGKTNTDFPSVFILIIQTVLSIVESKNIGTHAKPLKHGCCDSANFQCQT